MPFKKTARNAGKHFGMAERNSVETLTVLHEVINDLIDLRITINLEELFRTKYTSTKFSDNKKIAENKKAVKRALSSGENLYVYPRQKFLTKN